MRGMVDSSPTGDGAPPRRRQVEPAPTPASDPIPTRRQALDEYAAAAAALAGTPLVTRRQACAMTDTSLAAWDSYVSRRIAPQPVGFHPLTGAKMWDMDAVRDWDKDRVRYSRRKASRGT